jgi:hypothetical protein
MTFADQGFLSDADSPKAAEAHQRWAGVFTLATSINAFAMRTVWALEIDTSRKERAVGALMFVRAVRAYQAALMLARQGMCTESLGLCRTAVECIIHIAKLARDPEHVHELERAHARHRITQAEKMIAFGERIDSVTLQGLQSLATEQKPSIKINYEQLAEEVGLEVLYQVLYRGTSGYAAHATMGALNTHLNSDAGEVDILFSPQWGMLEQTLSFVVPVGIDALTQIAVLFELADVTEEVVRLSSSWQALSS